jgi:hypothetical protein
MKHKDPQVNNLKDRVRSKQCHAVGYSNAKEDSPVLFVTAYDRNVQYMSIESAEELLKELRRAIVFAKSVKNPE